MQKLGCFGKFRIFPSTEIFKTEEEMTETMKPKVGNPPQQIGGIHCIQCLFIYHLSNSLVNLGLRANTSEQGCRTSKECIL